jgi:CheY-like chemotaxis protein
VLEPMEQKEIVHRDRTARLSWSSAARSGTAKVLCVDDNASFLTAFSALLEFAGFSVTATTDPAHGLALALSAVFDLAILDYHMPGMNGAQLARKIRQRRQGMPLLLLSANESVPAADLRLFDRYLAKGGNFQEVLLAVRTSLASEKSLSAA